ncbi:Sterol O-acyltransferase 2 [Anabarilius grahami]|uniref:O-acyltransferase n=1 Tax=Anabarilius grahami TaxID=495550 RepID=A0A3N0XYL3_ANAGA|nr:Sterol O-acyltransferase 2 [Anabarilius grahami]
MSSHDSSAVRRTGGRTAGGNQRPSENGSIRQHDNHTNMREEDMQRMKAAVIRHVQTHLNEALERALTDSMQSLSTNTHTHTDETGTDNRHKLEQGKVFIARCSLLELVLDFDLFYYAFGQLNTVIWAWTLMFGYTLLGPYHVLRVWGGLYHSSRWRTCVSAGSALLLCTAQMSMLGIFPVYVVLHYQLPPASRFIIILEQIRFLMKSYSFIRETTPAVLRHTPQKDESLRYPSLSSYLYFLFCPTLIYREVYPRNPYIRWNYVGMNFLKILASLFYLYFILVRLCIPVFRNKSNQPFSTRTLILALFHAAFPGMLILMLGFYAFLHCWLNAFAEMLRFADRMFYKDWWNSTSFANYYRTWNIVVHDWLYYYGYRDFLWLSGSKLRSVATLSVFAVSALVHEYAFTMGFGFFYPVMFCTFAGIGVVFNFAMNDKRKSPVWNIIMWTCLFIGQGIHVCLYCLEWYAQIHCPRTGVRTEQYGNYSTESLHLAVQTFF